MLAHQGRFPAVFAARNLLPSASLRFLFIPVFRVNRSRDASKSRFGSLGVCNSGLRASSTERVPRVSAHPVHPQMGLFIHPWIYPITSI